MFSASIPAGTGAGGRGCFPRFQHHCLQSQGLSWLCPSEVGASIRWCLLWMIRGGRTECTGIAACLEQAQVHSSDSILQLLNALASSEEDTLYGCPGGLGKSHQGWAQAQCSFLHQLVLSKPERYLACLHSCRHANIPAGMLIPFVGCFTSLTNYSFFGLACGTPVLCCAQDMTKGLIHLSSIKVPWAVTMLSHINVFPQPGWARENESV